MFVAQLLPPYTTGALDSHTGEQVVRLLAELNQQGQTILLATHDLELARRNARRVIGLRDGGVISDSCSVSEPEGAG